MASQFLEQGLIMQNSLMRIHIVAFMFEVWMPYQMAPYCNSVSNSKQVFAVSLLYKTVEAVPAIMFYYPACRPKNWKWRSRKRKLM